MKKISIFQKIMDEKKKAISKYSNLQSKREQLNLLISQIEKISFSSGSISRDEVNCKVNADNDLDLMRPAARMLTNELSQVKRDQDEVNRDIKSLKDKIDKLNQKLKVKF